MRLKRKIMLIIVLILVLSQLIGCLDNQLTEENVSKQIEIKGNGRVEIEKIAGRKVKLKAVPSDDWKFVGWGVDLKTDKNPKVLKVKSGIKVKAEFIQDDYGVKENVLLVKQAGQKVEIKNNQVTLEKEPFELQIAFKKELRALVHASFSDKLYNKIKHQPEYSNISINGGGSVAMPENCKDLVVIKNPTNGAEKFDLPSYYYLYYDQDETCFGDVKQVGDYLVGRKKFENVYIIDRENSVQPQIPIKELDSDVLFLTFVYKNKKKLDCLQINFK